jgi:CarD family transcriptional regulator
MFQKGDKISYPMHGAGIIESVEECTVLDETRRYYVLRFAEGDIKVRIPVESAEKSGLRQIITADECMKVMESFKEPENVPECSNWNRRNRENLEKMKTGNVFEIAAVIRSLLRRETRRNLSSSEKKMLGTSMQILASELALAKGQKDEDVIKSITAMR